VFFFSSPEIWYRATKSSNLKKLCRGDEKLIEIPTKQVWFFKIDKNNTTVNSQEIFRFDMEVSDAGKKWEAEEIKTIIGPKHELSVVSHLDKKTEEVKEPEYRPIDRSFSDCFNDGWDNMHLDVQHEDFCQKIVDLAKDIEVAMNNSVMEGSMNSPFYEELLQYLEQTKEDLEGTLRLIRQ
jgi:hypothetical protein